MNDANYKLTTVKVLSDNYSKFKVKTLNTDMTLQKLVNRAIQQYLNDTEFCKQIETTEIYPDNKKY